MLRRIGVVVIWSLATLGTASLTYAAVSSAGRAVGNDPSAPVAGAEIAARISTTTTTTIAAVEGSSTTTFAFGETTITTATTLPGTTTTAPAGPPTTAAPVVTTTATTTQHWKTVPGVGTVGVAVSGDEVTLVSATPVTPFHVDVEDDGPEKVEVEFDSESAEYQVRATVQDGELVWEVDQSGEGSEGGGEG